MLLTHEDFMRRCLKLAFLGKGKASPNPLVGSVVVHQGKIIGEGYHMKYGQAHAEVNAINSVEDKALLKSSIIYVNLEPCAHFGKTPPCANLIIEMGIPEVVIGCIDTFSEVSGKGIQKMRDAGIKVSVGVLEEESRFINRRFFTSHELKRPYVILKWAETNNGYIDIERSEKDKGIFWITAPETRTLVHQWRSEEDAILVGNKTVINDNPSLTTRDFKGKSPIRIILDPHLKLNISDYTVGDNKNRTIILNKSKQMINDLIEYKAIENWNETNILNCLYKLDIQSVIIEGGKTTLNHFIEAGLWDEARILTGNNPIEKGIKSPVIEKDNRTQFYYGKDKVSIISKVSLNQVGFDLRWL